MAWADLQLPEDQLAAMLVECQPVRAIVANPSATWSELAAVLDAGTVAAGSTADKVTTSAFIEDESDSAYISRPRFVVAAEDVDNLSRTSSSGFSKLGRLSISAELQIPPSLIGNRPAAKNDIRQKKDAIESALLLLEREYPRLDIENADFDAGVAYSPEHNGELFLVIEGKVTYRGAVFA